MDTRDAGLTDKRRADIQRRADARLALAHAQLLACKTKRDLIEVVARLKKMEFQRGYMAGRRAERAAVTA